MFRTFSFILVVLAAAWTAPAVAQDYQDKDLAEAGASFRKDLLDGVRRQSACRA